MNNLLVKEDIESMIYEVRGKNVILDSDLAKLFEYVNGTKDINKAVKRHIEKFDEKSYFQLSNDEYYDILRFQIGTLELEQGKYSKYLPYVFTREGVAILGTIMRGEKVKYAVEEILYNFDKLESKNNLIIKGQNMNNMLFEIRGIKVILDSDLAYLYKCKNGTKEVNQAVKNNLEKFPENYVFRLTKEECEELSRSKVLTLNEGRGSNIKYYPYVFTEQGVLMLATILHTKEAIETSIKIVMPLSL